MRILVTGASGFVGLHLLDVLNGEGGHVVLALAGRSRPGSADLPRRDGVDWRRVDLRSQAEIGDAVGTFRPEGVVHLAARTQIVESDQDPAGTLEINAVGTLRLLEALARRAPDSKVVLVSSAAVYGSVAEKDLPAREGVTPVRPEGVYGVSKATAEMLAHFFESSAGLAVVVVRPFNVIGPGQTDRFAASSFAKQLAEMEAGFREPALRVGNLRSRRDVTDVRDVARALRLALDLPPSGPYNVCSGRAVSMTELVGLLLRVSGVNASVEVEPNRLRTNEIAVVLGDPSRFVAASGWKRPHGLEDSLRDLYEDWRRRVRGSPA
jgi:GDP-4-dehydro-6-deoxy-D-mannose reductase